MGSGVVVGAGVGVGVAVGGGGGAATTGMAHEPLAATTEAATQPAEPFASVTCHHDPPWFWPTTGNGWLGASWPITG